MLINFNDIDLDVLLSNYHIGDLPLGNASHGAVRGPLALVSRKVLRCLAGRDREGQQSHCGSPAGFTFSSRRFRHNCCGDHIRRARTRRNVHICHYEVFDSSRQVVGRTKRLQRKTEEHVA